jgi:hypothetical protein
MEAICGRCRSSPTDTTGTCPNGAMPFDRGKRERERSRERESDRDVDAPLAMYSALMDDNHSSFLKRTCAISDSNQAQGTTSSLSRLVNSKKKKMDITMLNATAECSGAYVLVFYASFLKKQPNRLSFSANIEISGQV